MRPPTADLSPESTLAHCELFEPLSDEQVSALADHCRMVSFKEGEALFDQDTAAHVLFVVESGRLAIKLATPAGRVIEVVEVGQYGLAGWSSLVAPGMYVARATALEDSTVLTASADEVEAILLREPQAGYQVMKKAGRPHLAATAGAQGGAPRRAGRLTRGARARPASQASPRERRWTRLASTASGA
ncbi:MAG: Cyclic nucleotide-binding domain protein [Actinobacteria bacterium ADurb.BinA094]|nr:MAG: Cyclic nucleotide-binding domain protein [Actinobacteria bacterium ADurb.BinA094]